MPSPSTDAPGIKPRAPAKRKKAGSSSLICWIVPRSPPARSANERLGSRAMVPRAVGVGSPWGVELRMSQAVVQAVGELVGHGVFQAVGLVVDLIPRVTHHRNEERFDQAVAAQNTACGSQPGGGPPGAVGGGVGEQ